MKGRFMLVGAVVAVAAASGGAPALARTVPREPPFRVLVMDHIPATLFARFARRGAVGLLQAEIGPTTNRRQALAELERGAEVNARLGGVPPGAPSIWASRATGAPSATDIVVVQLPPPGRPVPNDRRYRIAVIGGGFHGLLTSPTTRIRGLVSVVDIAPTALGHADGELSSTPSSRPLDALSRLDAQIHGEDRLKYPALFIVTAALILFGLLRRRVAATAIPGALLANLVLGVTAISNEVAIVALFTTGTLAASLLLARLCTDDRSLLAIVCGVVLLYALLLVAHPEWVAVTPLGPDQNQRFWGFGDQIATLLLAPLLVAAAVAQRRLGAPGFAAVAVLALFVMTDNRLGANGGGAIGLGVGLAVLAARRSRRGLLGLVAALLASAATVLVIVVRGLAAPGPNHLRSAFSGGPRGLIDVVVNRVPLAYSPAVHGWPLTLPLAVCLVGAVLFAWRRADADRDLLIGLVAAVGASLLANDATGFMLAAGIAGTFSLLHPAELRTPATARAFLPALLRAEEPERV